MLNRCDAHHSVTPPPLRIKRVPTLMCELVQLGCSFFKKNPLVSNEDLEMLH